MNRFQSFLSSIVRISAAIILVQMLYVKFTAAPVSVHVFSTLGMEPAGRIGFGIMETCAAALLLFSRSAWYGAVLALLVMGFVMYFQLIVFGPAVKGDGGKLFALSFLVGFCSLSTLYLHYRQVPFFRKKKKEPTVFAD